MLYHVNKGFPFQMSLPGVLKLSYSKHAIEEAACDKYGAIILSTELATAEKNVKIIEIETDDKTGKPIKFVVRSDYKGLDLFTVISLREYTEGRMTVVTVWLHPKNNRNKPVALHLYDSAPKKDIKILKVA